MEYCGGVSMHLLTWMLNIFHHYQPLPYSIEHCCRPWKVQDRETEYPHWFLSAFYDMDIQSLDIFYLEIIRSLLCMRFHKIKEFWELFNICD